MAKVHVELFMPLFLQLVSKQADVGPRSFRLLLLQLLPAGIAVADVRGNLCRSTWRQIQSSIQLEILQHCIT